MGDTVVLAKVLENKELEGLRVTLKAVDVILDSLLEQIREQVAATLQSAAEFKETGDMGATMGTLIRLTVQANLLKGLRKSIPEVVLYGDASTLARLV